ncbi:hypothetical protein ACFL4K_00045 [Candidatus Neomarinimicrobiota bacterium]
MNAPPADMALILARLDSIDRRLDGQHVSPWFTSAQAAEYLRCSPRQIEKLSRLGLLPFHRQDPTIPKSPRLYHRRHLTSFLVVGKNPIKHHLSREEKRLVEELL